MITCRTHYKAFITENKNLLKSSSIFAAIRTRIEIMFFTALGAFRTGFHINLLSANYG